MGAENRRFHARPLSSVGSETSVLTKNARATLLRVAQTREGFTQCKNCVETMLIRTMLISGAASDKLLA